VICLNTGIRLLLASRLEKRYNESEMTAEIVRLLLVGCLVAMDVLAMAALRRRKLTLGQFTAWGLFALAVPALGPFLAILKGRARAPFRNRRTRR
jgi:hypothetical protein